MDPKKNTKNFTTVKVLLVLAFSKNIDNEQLCMIYACGK
jgi:hypothetical protein